MNPNTSLQRLGRLACGLAMAAIIAPAWAQRSTVPAAQTAACPPVLDHTVPRLQDEKPQHLCQYAGRVVLVVNTASYCGYTGQYKGLENLHRRYRDQGLVVLGFPSNDFSQEPGANRQIAEFCESTFGVQFPMFAKTTVRGSQANALYRQLASLSGQAPAWNFHKYLISRDGRVVHSYASSVEPENRKLIMDIELQLLAR